jgi:hypothetical protein
MATTQAETPLPPSMRLKAQNARLAQGTPGQLVPFQETLTALWRLLITVATTRRIVTPASADKPAESAQAEAAPQAAGDALALAPARQNAPVLAAGRDDDAIAVNAEVVQDDLLREFLRYAVPRKREELERLYAMPDDVHTPAIQALESAFAASSTLGAAANDNASHKRVAAAIAGLMPPAGRNSDGNSDQALNQADAAPSDLARRLQRIAQLAENGQPEQAVVEMRQLMAVEANRLETSWPQIAAAAEQNPRLASVLDTAVLGRMERSASND